jgi:RNA polymerase sigma-54 factor
MSITLRQDQRLVITQKQKLKLVASQQLRMFLKLLQKPHLELQEYIAQEMKENPVLEDTPIEEESAPKEKDQEVRPVQGDLTTTPSSPAIINQFDSQHFMEYYSRMRGDDGEGIRYTQDEPPLVETIVSGAESLADHLMWQLRLSEHTQKELEIGEYIIGNLNEEGYLVDTTPQEIARHFDVEPDIVERVRSRIMSFDPVGCGAMNMQESLIATSA